MRRQRAAVAHGSQGHDLLARHGAREARSQLEQRAVVLLAGKVAHGAVTRFGSSDGRIADSSALSGLRFRIGAAGPNIVACSRRDERPGDRLGVADVGHRRRKAARRRCGASARPDSTAASRVSGTVGIRSKPCRRASSSTMQASVETSCRQDGGVTSHSSGPPANPKPEAAAGSARSRRAQARCRPGGRAGRGESARGDLPAGTAPAITTSPGSPPHSSRISRVACSVPGSTSSGSRPRSKRVRASLSIPSLRPVAAVRSGSNRATSSSTSVVVGVDAGALTAHDPAKADGAAGVGDHGHAVGQNIGLAVQRQQLLARPRRAQHDIALQLARVEHVQRPAEVEGQIVGDVDQGRDRPQADGLQPVLQPGRARRRCGRRESSGRRTTGRPSPRHREGQRDPDAGRAAARHRREIPAAQPAEAGGGEVAGDAGDAEAVAAVRRQLDLDHRAFQAQHLGRGRADLDPRPAAR